MPGGIANCRHGVPLPVHEAMRLSGGFKTLSDPDLRLLLAAVLQTSQGELIFEMAGAVLAEALERNLAWAREEYRDGVARGIPWDRWV